jgi:hypothetical protein
MPPFPAAVHTLERELRGIFGSRLQSLVVYGLAAQAPAHGDDHGGAHAHGTAPTHTMAIVDALTADDLRGCSERAASWHDAGLATPLVLASQEFERSLDAFPFEFGAILSDHVLVAGSNPFEGLTVDRADFRRACEIQARSHLLHLREAYIETRGRGDALAVLIVSSAPSFAALVSSVERLDGQPLRDVGAAARHLERALELAGTPVSDIVALVGVREISSPQGERLFRPYLDAVERIVKYVDQWR